MIVALLNSGAFWAFATLALLAALLAFGDRHVRQDGVADIRAQAHVRLSHGEAIPYDREAR